MPEPRHARIQVRLRDLAQLFNSMDPAPFIERDLDDDAEAFICGSARELGSARPYEILVHLQNPPEPEKAAALEPAVRHFFAERAKVKRAELRQLLRRGRVSLLIGVVFLSGCLGVGQAIDESAAGTLGGILRESLIIGGWVAMWRPLEIFLYDWWPVRDELQMLAALARSRVRLAPPAGGTAMR